VVVDLKDTIKRGICIQGRPLHVPGQWWRGNFSLFMPLFAFFGKFTASLANRDSISACFLISVD
jgi:hypothetical protein